MPAPISKRKFNDDRKYLTQALADEIQKILFEERMDRYNEFVEMTAAEYWLMVAIEERHSLMMEMTK